MDWLIRYVHANGASMFFWLFIFIFLDLCIMGLIIPREIIWIIGMIIYF